VLVCPSWVCTEKKLSLSLFDEGLLLGGGKNTEGGSLSSSSGKKTETGGTGSLRGGDGINLSSSLEEGLVGPGLGGPFGLCPLFSGRLFLGGCEFAGGLFGFCAGL